MNFFGLVAFCCAVTTVSSWANFDKLGEVVREQAKLSSLSTELKQKLQVLLELKEDGVIHTDDYNKAKDHLLSNFLSPSVHTPSSASSSPASYATFTTSSPNPTEPVLDPPDQNSGGPFNKMIWNDEFSAPSIDATKWKHVITASGGGNWEFEYYMNNRSNSFIRDGELYLKPTLTSDTLGESKMLSGGTLDLWGGVQADLCTSNAFYGCQRASDGNNIINPIQSARLRTAETFNFKYGRLEIRAKLPKGDWLWPALWLLPKDQLYGVWPGSGEIDLMESRGNDINYAQGGFNAFGSTLHWGPFFGQDQWAATHAEKKADDLHNTFHVYGLEWTDTYLVTYLDTRDNVVMNIPFPTGDGGFWEKGGWDKMAGLNNIWKAGGGTNHAPFDQEFFIIMNVAAGGVAGYFPDGVGGKCWTNTDPHAALDFWKCKNQWYATWNGDEVAMIIDYVRVYQ